MKKKFSIRFFVETSDNEDAQSVTKQIISSLPESFEIEIKYIKKYWKITEYFECLLEIQDRLGETEESFALICKVFGENWLVRGSGLQIFGVWNTSNNNISNYEKVKWVNVEIIP